MKVDRTKLLQLIAAAPKILAVRLADRFDCDIEDIENAILPHLNRRIFAHEVTGPNGLKANGYTLSDQCLADVLAGQGARDPEVERRAAIREDAPGVNMDIAGARSKAPPFPVAAKLVTPAKSAEARVTKPQLAIDLLKAAPGNRCTTKEILAALGLPLTSSPNSYLREPLKDGRLARAGQDWVLGDGKPVAPLDSVEKVGNIIIATKDASPVPQAVVDAIAAPSDLIGEMRQKFEQAVVDSQPAKAVQPAVQPQLTAPTFRCGIWSDDVLELQRDGETIAKLTRLEGEHTADFLARMWGKAEQVAA